jgi:hypothetical protein
MSTVLAPLKQRKNRRILEDWNPIRKFLTKPFGKTQDAAIK